jgi:hypothetical protein
VGDEDGEDIKQEPVFGGAVAARSDRLLKLLDRAGQLLERCLEVFAGKTLRRATSLRVRSCVSPAAEREPVSSVAVAADVALQETPEDIGIRAFMPGSKTSPAFRVPATRPLPRLVFVLIVDEVAI